MDFKKPIDPITKNKMLKKHSKIPNKALKSFIEYLINTQKIYTDPSLH